MGFFKRFSQTGFSVFEKLGGLLGVDKTINQEIAKRTKKELNKQLNYFLKLTRHRIILCFVFSAFNILTLYVFKNKLLILAAFIFSFLFLMYLVWNILNFGKTIWTFLLGNVKEQINQKIDKHLEDELKSRPIASLFASRDHYNVFCGVFLESLGDWVKKNKKRLSYTLLLYAVFYAIFSWSFFNAVYSFFN